MGNIERSGYLTRCCWRREGCSHSAMMMMCRWQVAPGSTHAKDIERERENTWHVYNNLRKGFGSVCRR